MPTVKANRAGNSSAEENSYSCSAMCSDRRKGSMSICNIPL